MLRILSAAKLSIIAVVAIVSSMLVATPSAEAQWRGHGARSYHAAPARIAYRPVYRPVYRPRYVQRSYGWRPYYRPRFVGAPIYVPAPVYGYRCVIKKRWVAGPYGWQVVRRRVCF